MTKWRLSEPLLLGKRGYYPRCVVTIFGIRTGAHHIQCYGGAQSQPCYLFHQDQEDYVVGMF
jgi:hypothetical protein